MISIIPCNTICPVVMNTWLPSRKRHNYLHNMKLHTCLAKTAISSLKDSGEMMSFPLPSLPDASIPFPPTAAHVPTGLRSPPLVAGRPSHGLNAVRLPRGELVASSHLSNISSSNGYKGCLYKTDYYRHGMRVTYLCYNSGNPVFNTKNSLVPNI